MALLEWAEAMAGGGAQAHPHYWSFPGVDAAGILSSPPGRGSCWRAIEPSTDLS